MFFKSVCELHMCTVYHQAENREAFLLKVCRAGLAQLEEQAHIYRDLLLDVAIAGSTLTCGPLLHDIPPLSLSFHVFICPMEIKA